MNALCPPGGSFTDSSVSVDGNVQDSQVIRVQDPVFFDRFRDEVVVSNQSFSGSQNTNLDSAVGTLTGRVDGPPVFPGGANPFFTVGSSSIFNNPTNRQTTDLGDGGDFELRSKLENNVNFGLGRQIPVCGNSCPFPVSIDLGIGAAWNEISYRGSVGGDSIRQSTDVWYLGPIVGVSGVVHKTDRFIISLFVNGGFLFEIDGGDENIRVGDSNNGARINLSSDRQYNVNGGVRVGFKPPGN